MEEASEDSCSFSTITTLTETPSQKSFDSIEIDQSEDNENDITLSQSPLGRKRSANETLFTEKLDLLIKITQKGGKVKQKEIVDTCQELRFLYMQESSGNHHDVDRLKKLASRYSALLLTVDQKSRSMAILKNANNELNQYISNMEEYHTKQLGSLQAKLSLTRIVKEVQNQSLSSVESASSPGKSNEQKKMRKKRSSLLFWRRSSKSTSSLLNGISENSEETANKLQEELFKKSVLIEQLRKQCTDYEQKEKILVTAIHNKNIELSMKTNRMNEMGSDIKVYQRDQKTCHRMLSDVEAMAANTKLEFEEIQANLMEQRVSVKDHSSKMKKLDWMMKKLNEENKLLLTKLNTKNYEMSCEKLQNEEIVCDVKKFLLTLINMTYHDREADQDQTPYPETSDEDNDRNILKSLMRILQDNVTKVFKSSSSMSKESVICYKESACQTDDSNIKLSHVPDNHKIGHRRKLPLIPAEMTCSSFDSDISSFQVERDSGVSIHDEAYLTLEQQVRQQRNEYEKRPSLAHIPRNREYKQTFKENKELSNDFLGYVEYMKNREIAGYKEDLKGLEKENYLLKSSLDESNNKLKRLKHELSYRKPIRKDDVPFTSTPEHQKPTSGFPHRKINESKELSKSKKDEKNLYCHSIPTYNFTPPSSYTDKLDGIHKTEHRTEMALESKPTEDDHTLFMKSFEHSNALIHGIFKEKDELQRQLELSRQQARNKRNSETSRMLA